MRDSTQAKAGRSSPSAGQSHMSVPGDGARLRLVSRPAHNLPIQLSSFIGRARELTKVAELLDGARLLTLTGPGGCGKTRLALRVANELADTFVDGVCFVELAGLEDAALLPQTVARSLGLHEQHSRRPIDALAEHLRAKRLLLVLDNCEHLVAASARLADTLLRAGPQLNILATSREALHVEGEQLFLVPPLALPQVPVRLPIFGPTAAFLTTVEPVSDIACPGYLPGQAPGVQPGRRISLVEKGYRADGAAERSLGEPRDRQNTDDSTWQIASKSEAVELFVARASARAPAFRLSAANLPAVIRICHQLDGLPLAIELAAARVSSLSVEQIAARLGDGLRLLTVGSPAALPQHQTLRAAIEWSHALLDEDEKMLFRRLAVFAGGWTLDAAEEVCTGMGVDRGEVLDLLARLVDKSLVVMVEHAGQTRYRMLELVRQYAGERLRMSSESDAVQHAHAANFLRLLQSAEPHFLSATRRLWLTRLEPDHDNVRAALRWATEIGDMNLYLQLASTCWRFWYYNGYWNEGRGWLETGLGHYRGRIEDCSASDQTAISRLRTAIGKALYAVGWITWWQGDPVSARSWLEQSIAVWYDLDSQAESVLDGRVHAQFFLSYVMLGQGDAAGARPLAEECLAVARTVGDPWRLGFALSGVGNVARAQGRYAEAIEYYEESIARFRELGEAWGLVVALGELSNTALRSGDYAGAVRHCRESLALCQGLGDIWSTSRCLEDMATALYRLGEALRAAKLFGAGEALRETIGAFVPEGYRPDYASTVAEMRASLGPGSDAIWAEGRAMTPEQAIILALASTTDSWKSESRQLGTENRPLRLYALGTPRVERCGQVLTAAEWGYAQPRELLFYLLSHRERTKQQVGLAFWPDVAPVQLRSNFHRTLHHLRQALGSSDWVVHDQAGYAFNRELPYWYDVEAFEAHLETGRQSETDDSAEAIRHLEAAIDLYQGDFLQESSGDWHFPHQRALRERYQDALLLLGKLLSACNRDHEAAKIYRRAITHDSLLEEAHRALMRCYARQGERGQALRHYQSLVELLRDEIGADPAPETAALYQQLRCGDVVL
jgi:predicted ATPase/DNA-binding SARP family transcriptional activator